MAGIPRTTMPMLVLWPDSVCSLRKGQHRHLAHFDDFEAIMQRDFSVFQCIGCGSMRLFLPEERAGLREHWRNEVTSPHANPGDHENFLRTMVPHLYIYIPWPEPWDTVFPQPDTLLNP